MIADGRAVDAGLVTTALAPSLGGGGGGGTAVEGAVEGGILSGVATEACSGRRGSTVLARRLELEGAFLTMLQLIGFNRVEGASWSTIEVGVREWD